MLLAPAQGAPVTVAPGTTLTIDQGDGTTFSSDILNNGTVEGAEGAGITNTLSGTISGSGVFVQTGAGTSILSGTNTFSSGTTLSAGRLVVDGSIVGDADLHTGTEIGGHGTVAGRIHGSSSFGSGAVGPGHNVGILTAGGVDPSNGMAFNMEFTQAGAPVWSLRTSSGNDVLHLMGASPFSTPLVVANQVNVYFTSDHLTYEGGFFAEGPSDNLTLNLANATFTYYLLNNTSGLVSYGGNLYDLYSGGDVLKSVVPITGADFASGTVDGFTAQFQVGTVPEPGTWMLMLGGMAAMALVLWRKRGQI